MGFIQKTHVPTPLTPEQQVQMSWPGTYSIDVWASDWLEAKPTAQYHTAGLSASDCAVKAMQFIFNYCKGKQLEISDVDQDELLDEFINFGTAALVADNIVFHIELNR